MCDRRRLPDLEVCVRTHTCIGGIGGVRPSNQNGWFCRKDGASFRIHSRLCRLVKQIGEVENFFFLTQARTGRHIVEACPQPSPNSLTRLSPPATVLASEQRYLFCSDRVFIFNANRIAIRVQTKY